MSYDAECYCDEAEDDWTCVFCTMETEARLKNICKNLYDAAMLERSFDLGRKYADDLWDVETTGKRWRPGCKRAA